MERTIYSHLSAAARHRESQPALLGPEHNPLTHKDLVQQIERTVEALNQAGIGRRDRVAIALPDGPDAASCCLAVASGATAAPLRTGSSSGQFHEYLSAISPRALIVEDGGDSASIRVAQELGIPLIRLIADRGAPAGVFTLQAQAREPARDRGFASPADVALLMLTSGTTSRPKIAPLTHLNISSGAENNAGHLQLRADDRCLCVTTMSFTQGILVSVFSPLMVGGSSVVTPGYDPIQFFAWLDEFRPTWYAAPAAIQQSILGRAALWPEIISRSHLRVIRCTSSPVGPEFVAQMEELFRAPMLDAYGMTEASSTLAGQPIPPARRKPGSVGTATGCEIAIIDENGVFLPPGQVGEIVVRGPSVIRAYEAAPSVNEASFLDGWLRTGDLGRLEDDGYLFLTGRIKELINRGGEKISPVEIDEALLSHRAVSQALAFSLPDEKLGEDVGALVVLREPASNSEELGARLRQHVSRKLSSSRVPRRIWIVDELPKTPTGKPQRIGVAEKLGLTASRQATSNGRAAVPASESDVIQSTLTHIWEDTLRRRPIGPDEEFFDLGGDSLLAAEIALRIGRAFGCKLGLPTFFEAPTIARMAALLRRAQVRVTPSQVIPIQSCGSRAPLYLVGLYPLFRPLILRMSDEQPIFGVSYADLSTIKVPFQLEDFAAGHIRTLREKQPHGPYVLGGWCKDGVLAYEVAQQLTQAGEPVPLLILIDCFNPVVQKRQGSFLRSDRIEFHLANLSRIEFPAIAGYCMERLRTVHRRVKSVSWRAAYRLRMRVDRRVDHRFRNLTEVLSLAAAEYIPKTYAGRVLLVRAHQRPAGHRADAAHGWRDLIPNLAVVDAAGDHVDMFREPQVDSMASILEAELRRANLPADARLTTDVRPMIANIANTSGD